jgi:hypothetical protein
MHRPEGPLRAAPWVCYSKRDNCHKGPAKCARLGPEPLEAVTSGPVTSSLTAANPVVGLVVGLVVPTTFRRTDIPLGFPRLGTGHQWSTRSPLRCRITGARPSIDPQPRRHFSPRARAVAHNRCQWPQIARARRGVRRGARTGAKTPHWTPPIRAHKRGSGARDLLQSTVGSLASAHPGAP